MNVIIRFFTLLLSLLLISGCSGLALPFEIPMFIAKCIKNTGNEGLPMRVKYSSKPEGAEVWLGDQLLGETPLTVTYLVTSNSAPSNSLRIISIRSEDGKEFSDERLIVSEHYVYKMPPIRAKWKSGAERIDEWQLRSGYSSCWDGTREHWSFFRPEHPGKESDEEYGIRRIDSVATLKNNLRGR